MPCMGTPLSPALSNGSSERSSRRTLSACLPPAWSLPFGGAEAIVLASRPAACFFPGWDGPRAKTTVAHSCTVVALPQPLPALQALRCEAPRSSVDPMPTPWLVLVALSALARCGLPQTQRMHAVPSPGCGRRPPVDPAVGRGQYLDLEVDGWARGVLLRLPTSYDEVCVCVCARVRARVCVCVSHSSLRSFPH